MTYKKCKKARALSSLVALKDGELGRNRERQRKRNEEREKKIKSVREK